MFRVTVFTLCLLSFFAEIWEPTCSFIRVNTCAENYLEGAGQAPEKPVVKKFGERIIGKRQGGVMPSAARVASHKSTSEIIHRFVAVLSQATLLEHPEPFSIQEFFPPIEYPPNKA